MQNSNGVPEFFGLVTQRHRLPMDQEVDDQILRPEILAFRIYCEGRASQHDHIFQRIRVREDSNAFWRRWSQLHVDIAIEYLNWYQAA